jgi:hypothetical protein
MTRANKASPTPKVSLFVVACILQNASGMRISPMVPTKKKKLLPARRAIIITVFIITLSPQKSFPFSIYLDTHIVVINPVMA